MYVPVKISISEVWHYNMYDQVIIVLYKLQLKGSNQNNIFEIMIEKLVFTTLHVQ